ncbi:MAG: FHA domain-containing protein [Hyphomicrobiaceae bacterium]
MKPKDSTDPLDRHNAAGAPTVIIGDTSGHGGTPQPTPPGSASNAQTSLINVQSGAAHAASPPRAIPSDPGHTRIISPYASSGPAEGPQATEPVVGWLVVLDGPGKGNHRGIYNGSNTIGRSSSQRIAINFGDDTISGEQQAFLVYDAKKRQFQLVPNLGRPNLVHLNDAALLSNAELKLHDKITMGRTTLLFVPLCGPDFDWSDMDKKPGA